MFKTSLPVPRGGQLRLTLPNEINLPGGGGINSVRVTRASNMQSGSSVSLTTGVSSKIIVFSNGFSSTYVTEGISISFTLQHLQNPIDNVTTGSFTIATFDEAGFAIEALSTGLTVSA